MSTDTELHDAIAVILKQANSFQSDKISKELLKQIKTEHRTIQQSFVREIHTFLVTYGSKDFSEYGDARNEGARDFAKKVGELEVSFPFI